MLRTAFLASFLAMLLTPAGLFAAEPEVPISSWIGDDAVIVLEVTQPAALLDRVFSDDVVKAVTTSPVYQQILAAPQAREAMNLVKYFEGRYQTDLHGLLKKLTGGGLSLAVGPNESALLIVEAEDPALLTEAHDFFVMAAKNEAQKANDVDRVKSAEYRGVTGWSFNKNEAHAIVGNRLLLANKPDLLKAALDRRAQEGGKSIADVPVFQTAQKAAGPSACARAFVNLAVLKAVPQFSAALNRNENPLGTLLVAPFLSALREANWLSAGLEVQGSSVQLAFVADGAAAKPDTPSAFGAALDPQDGALANLTVPRQIASASLFRDLHGFYAAKDQLFPERTSGLIFFENMMGIFFTGRDLTEEVLAETMPDIRVVVAEQQYDPKYGTPKVQFPGFALVMRLRDPEKSRPIAEEAWQKALGLINFTRGQQALPGLIIDRPALGDVRYSTAAFAPDKPSDGSGVDVRFNFQPALAMPGPYLILSSTDALARDLIEALQREAASGAKPVAKSHSLFELRAPQVVSILKANWEAIIQQNMVEKGNQREQSEQEMGLLLTVLSYLKSLDAQAGSDNGQSTLNVRLDLQAP